MRSLIALGMLCLLLLPASAFAAPIFWQYLTQVPVVVQRSGRYATEMYTYYKKPFTDRGCGPASVANAFAVACAIPEQSLTDTLMRELMREMTYNHTPTTTPISADGIANLMEPDAAYSPMLHALREDYGAYWMTTGETVTWETIAPFLSEALKEKQKALFAGCFAVRGHWGEVAEMLREMDRRGMGDAIVCLTLLSSGTSGTPAPFRLNDGHFETIAFRASEFAEYGTMFLVDSSPRALPWEEKVRGTYYDVYPLDDNEEMLTESFEVKRVTPSVLRLRLLDSVTENLLQVRETEGEAAYREAEAAYYEKLLFYGTGVLLVTLPQGM
ncbi:MAG: hypothetical protein IJ865_01220 [Clostridia bacterium]|nr:hypothetical protein [Clostridia bacterium]